MKISRCKTKVPFYGWWTISRCDIDCPRSGHFVAGDFWHARPSPDAARGDGFFAARKIPPGHRAFTLIELILVLALLVIITAVALPRMSGFIRGRALDSEARRLVGLMHAGQSRAVSEGAPMMLWVDEKTGSYGLEAETSGQNGDAKAEELTVDATLQLSVLSAVTSDQTTFKNLPAIKFLPEGTVAETSPPTLKLTDSAGFARWLTLGKTRMGYEINDTQN